MKLSYLFIGLVTLFSVKVARAEFVTCESEDDKRHYCAVDTRNGVAIVKQNSKADCTAGSSWNYDDRGIWVSHGCRAVFDVHGAGGGRESGEYGRPGYDRGGDYGRHEEPVAVEHCPSGFQPSEQKCSTEERRHGCKDMRLPGGLGCVHR